VVLGFLGLMNVPCGVRVPLIIEVRSDVDVPRINEVLCTISVPYVDDQIPYFVWIISGSFRPPGSLSS